MVLPSGRMATHTVLAPAGLSFRPGALATQHSLPHQFARVLGLNPLITADLTVVEFFLLTLKQEHNKNQALSLQSAYQT